MDETIITTDEDQIVNPESEHQDDLINSDETGHEEDKNSAGKETDSAFKVPEELSKEGISEGFIKKFYGNDEIGELDPTAMRIIKSAYSSEKRMRETENKLNEMLAKQQETAEQQKETEVKQISETVKTNYETLKSAIAKQKVSDLQQVEDLAAKNGQIAWYDGQVYQVTPENKHIFREKIAEKYTADLKEAENAFGIANKEALSKQQKLAAEKSEAGYQKYIESKKETFDKEPELVDAINFLKKETSFNQELAEDFIKLFPAYYEKRLERESKAEKMKSENNSDLEKLNGVSKLKSPAAKITTKNLTGSELLELSKKNPEAAKEYFKKL